MNIGVLTRTFARPDIDTCLDAVVSHGMRSVQLNLVSAGLPAVPDGIEPALCDRIRTALEMRGIEHAATTGAFNMIHPDPRERAAGMACFRGLASCAHRLGTRMLTLCTGTRDPANMWRAHPENGSAEAWRDLLHAMEEALAIAGEFDLVLGVEPEVSNVIDSAAKARSLLDAMGSPRLRIVMDGANIFHDGELPRMGEILREAFGLLGPDIALAHAKDLSRDGEAGQEAAGTGALDYALYIRLLHEAGFSGPLLLHSLREDQAPAAVAFLRSHLEREA